jgi:hypothetical protein
MKTIKTLDNILKDFSDRHPMILNYGSGQIYNISTKATNYVSLYYIPIGEETINGANILDVKILLMDLLETDNSNNIDIMSNLQQIKNDLYAEFTSIAKQYGFYIQNKYSFFDDEFDDLLKVLEIDIKIEYGNDINCLINNIE